MNDFSFSASSARMGLDRALEGAVVWIICAAILRLGPFEPRWPLLMVLIGAAVAVPLGLGLAEGVAMKAHRPSRLAVGCQWHRIAVGSLAVSLTLSPGRRAALATLPWVAETLRIAWNGLLFLGPSNRTLVHWLVGSGLFQLGIGGAWLLADRAGWAAFGFDGLIVRLTATHFHFAGFVLPMLTALTLDNRCGRSRVGSLAGLGVLAGVPLIAAGITFTKLGAPVEIEAGLAAAFSLAAFGIGLCQARLGWKQWREGGPGGRWLLVSGLALVAGMSLAFGYALRPWVRIDALHLSFMWVWHGSLQVFGFALPGLIGWHRFLPGGPPREAVGLATTA